VRAPERLAQIQSALAVVWRNRDLRRVQIAFAAFNCAEWSVWIAMLVYAYERGGATAAGGAALAQLVPATVCAPFVSVLADRRSPVLVLAAGYLAQTIGMAATAAVLFTDGRPALAVACAAFAATAVTVTRPTQAVLLPALARRPEELTAANVISGWNESVSMLVAPAITGVILGVAGPGTVFAVMAASTLGGALIVARVSESPAPAPTGDRGTLASITAGLRAVAREPAARLLVGMLAAEFAALGMLDVIYVALALDVLDIGQSGAGYLNAAFGLGGALGIAVTVSLVGRARLMPAVLVALGVWTAALVTLAALPTVATAFAALALAGGARSLFDVGARTLLQRTAPPAVLARVFGVLESLQSFALAAGSLAAPLLIAIGGGRAAVLGAALLLPALALVWRRRMLTLDRSAHVPVVEIALLRMLPLFAVLPPPELEGIAQSLQAVAVEEGEIVVLQGAPGDRYYAIADGTVEIASNGATVCTLARGEGFGEIALLRDVPRTGTARALTAAKLYALPKEPFLGVITGHPAAERKAATIVSERLGTPLGPDAGP
jgi:Na+/melibiose symporter-like transporter